MNAEELAMSLHSNVSEFRRGAQVRTVFRMSAKVPNSDNHTSCESTEPNRPIIHCQFDVCDEPSKSPVAAICTDGFQRKRRQSIYAKPINAIWELFSEYSNGSTIHGLRYLGEKRRHWTERIWWAVACLLSLVICGHLIMATWRKWEQFPVLVTFAEKSTHIDQIPFPAVTICPSTKIKQSLFNYTTAFNQIKNGEVVSANNMSTMRRVSNLCYQPLKSISTKDIYTKDDELFATLTEHVPTLKEVLFQCTWHEKRKNCSELFFPIWTVEGLCFTFNLLNASDLYTERRLQSAIPTTIVYPNGKPNNESSNPSSLASAANADENIQPTKQRKANNSLTKAGKIRRATLEQMYPRRASAASDNLVIDMRLYDKDTDYLCEGPVQGFKLLLHTVHETPQVDKYFYRVPLDHETIVSVRPELMDTSDSLVYYQPERRQCYFDWENRLQFFKVYTQRNCELECLTAKTLRTCRCVTFAMPRSAGTPVCGLGRRPCYNFVTLSADDNCNCLPACRSITYDAELSFARYNRRRYLHAQNITKSERRQYVRLAISFKDNQFFASHRRELYGPTDFLANCGGLLGLFMGFSLLSIVEVVYYCTLRLACNLYRRRRAAGKLATVRRTIQQSGVQ